MNKFDKQKQIFVAGPKFIEVVLLLTQATKITNVWSTLVNNCVCSSDFYTFKSIFILNIVWVIITTIMIFCTLAPYPDPQYDNCLQLGLLSAGSIAKSVEFADPLPTPYPQTDLIPTHRHLLKKRFMVIFIFISLCIGSCT